MAKLMDPFKRAVSVRKQLVNEKGEVLFVDFVGTKEEKDTTKLRGLVMDVKTGKFVYRYKTNIKELDPEWRKREGLPALGVLGQRQILDIMNYHHNFDIPNWFRFKAGDDLRNIAFYDIPLICQVMGCNFCGRKKTSGCLQCFVDNKSNSPDTSRGVWLSAESIVDAYESLYRKGEIKVLRISGGEPTLVLDFILRVCQELEKRSLPIFLHFDTNLSTGRVIEKFENDGIYPKFILERLAEYNPGILCSFKGTCDKDLQKNTQTNLKVDDQIYSFKKLVRAGFDKLPVKGTGLFPYIYNSNPLYLKHFIMKMESLFENFLLKTHIVITKSYYTPTKERIFAIAKEKGENPEIAFLRQVKKWEKDYYASDWIMRQLVKKYCGLEYKELQRPGIEIKIRK